MTKAENIVSILKKSKFRVNIYIESDGYVNIEVGEISDDALNLLIELLADNGIVMARSFKQLNDYSIVGEIHYTNNNHQFISVNGGV